jgi:transposase-like protein
MAEYKRLHKKNKQLEIENEVLKKAVAIFANDAQTIICPLTRERFKLRVFSKMDVI